MAPRRRCPTCGSKQWHKEPSSGLIACSEGHVLQNYRNEANEMEEVGPHSMKKRALKSDRKKKGRQSKADPKLYHGARGRYHYFLCLQLILRHQIAALTRLWELPPEFEVICKELWALHLALLPDPPPAEPYFHAQENQEDDEGVTDIKPSQESSDNEKEEAQANDDDLENELELDALMQENSDISDSSDEEDDDLVPAGDKKPGKSKISSAYESLVGTIAVLVVGCWTLRIPVMYRDFSRAIEMYKLPYLEAVGLLPESMVLHLTKHNKQALSPNHGPSTLKMHSLSSRLAKKIYANFGIHTPELNGSSMLWRITKDMGGTPMLYVLSKRLAKVLSIPLILHPSLAPELSKRRRSDPDRHHSDSAPAEVGLLAAVMIVLKMVYGLDGNERQEGDVACALPTREEYLEAMEGVNREVKFDSQIDMKVGDMSDSAIDEYIKFCGKALVRDTEELGGIEDIGVELIGSEYERILGVGGRIVGVSVEYLDVVMQRFERRITAAAGSY